MDLEADIKNLLEEDSYINSMIKALTGLKNRNGYNYLSNDISSLLGKLKEKRKKIKGALDDLSNEAVSVAEALSLIDLDKLDAELF